MRLEELTWPRRGAPGAGAERTPPSPTAEAAASSWSARYGKGCASWGSWTGWTPRGRPEVAATVASSCPPPPPPPGPCGKTYLGASSPAFPSAPSDPAPSSPVRGTAEGERTKTELSASCTAARALWAPASAQLPRSASTRRGPHQVQAQVGRTRLEPQVEPTGPRSPAQRWAAAAGQRHLLEALGTASSDPAPQPLGWESERGGISTAAQVKVPSVACGVVCWPLSG